VTAGGTTTGAATPNDANSANNLARTLEATPETDTNVVGEQHMIFATVRDASGNTLTGVTPSADVTAGPNNAQPATCDATDNNGVSRCTYTGTAAGTDTIVVYVNQDRFSGTTQQNTDALDAGEPNDTVTKTYQAAPAAGTTVTLTCDNNRTSAAGDACQNPTSDTTEGFTATVRNAAGTPVAGTLVRFTLAQTAGPVDANDTESLSVTEGVTDANGQITTVLTNTKPVSGEVFTVTAQIGQQGNATAGFTDTATKTWANPAANEARNITLAPESATSTIGDVRQLTATVTDRFGNPVENVAVTFNETGTGRFTNGTSQTTVNTGADGKASVEVTTQSNEAPGQQTVTASLPTTANADECEAAANTTTVGGQTTTAGAGNCSDSSTVNWVAATTSPSPAPTGTPASPSATPTATTSPGTVDCSVTPTVTLEFGTINATGSSGVTVNAPANSEIELLAYSQPSTTYRVVRRATINNDGDPAQFRIVPPTNTRLYAQIVGCDTDEVRFSKVLNVRTTLSLNVTRLGKQTYRFFGDSLPARPGGLIVSLYRVTNDGRQVLTAQTRANAQNGEWSLDRRFTGTGRFGFVVRTGQDLQNAPGASNVRSLLIF